jgi:hypothetical protein
MKGFPFKCNLYRYVTGLFIGLFVAGALKFIDAALSRGCLRDFLLVEGSNPTLRQPIIRVISLFQLKPLFFFKMQTCTATPR